MPCIHQDLVHDTAAEIFVVGLVSNWEGLLDLPGLAFWLLLALGVSLKVCGSSVVGVASAGAVIWSHSSTLLYALRAIRMLCVWALEIWFGGCLYHASVSQPQLGCGASTRHRPAEPQVPMAGSKPVQPMV